MSLDTYHDLMEEIKSLKEHITRKNNEIAELHQIIADLERQLDNNGLREIN